MQFAKTRFAKMQLTGWGGGGIVCVTCDDKARTLQTKNIFALRHCVAQQDTLPMRFHFRFRLGEPKLLFS